MDWTAGYVADIGYTFGYCTELNPVRARLSFLQAGLVPPSEGAACELGFGQGVSVNMHAAGSQSSWWGTDFNPSQAGFAKSLAGISGASAELSDEALEDFCHRKDLPKFDFIGLHGIWSWISDANRVVIVDFIRRRLKVGGVLYISYNTLPGWAAFAPMRHLLTKHAGVIGSSGKGIVSRIDGAIEFADQLLATNPLYTRANPQVAERITKLKEQNRHYLAHEYFNRDWHPMHFDTMQEWLAPAKVQFAVSANYFDYIDALHLTQEQQALLATISDLGFRECVRDFMVNQQFRKDYWVRGKRVLAPLDRVEALRKERFLLTSHRSDVALKVSGALRVVTLTEAVYAPILDIMSDHKIRSIGQLEAELTQSKANISLAQLIQAVALLVGEEHLHAAQADGVVNESLKRTQALNTQLMEYARSSPDMGYLVSPVTGGGLPVNRIAQLFLRSLADGKKEPEAWAADVLNFFQRQGLKLLKEGQQSRSGEDTLRELNKQASVFAEKQLPILRAAKIA